MSLINYVLQIHTERGDENRIKSVRGPITGNLMTGTTREMNENMRYVLRIKEEGQWDEKGEMNSVSRWLQFMEMKLDRID